MRESAYFGVHADRRGSGIYWNSSVMENTGTDDPLFRRNQPIMEFMRTQNPLLHHNHGLIPQLSRNSGSHVRILLRNG